MFCSLFNQLRFNTQCVWYSMPDNLIHVVSCPLSSSLFLFWVSYAHAPLRWHLPRVYLLVLLTRENTRLSMPVQLQCSRSGAWKPGNEAVTVHDSTAVASFPGPAQVSATCSMVMWERAWYLFSCEWCQDRKDLIVHGHTGRRTAKRARDSLASQTQPITAQIVFSIMHREGRVWWLYVGIKFLCACGMPWG